MLNADLHCHSTVSDGLLDPADVAQRASANGVQLWALTDHDEIVGIPEAQSAARDLGLPFVTGVEISVTWASHTIHIVGLDFDAHDQGLHNGLEHNRSGRDRRARDISAQLDKCGIPDTYKGALGYAGNPDLISRTHFARYLVEKGYCASISEVFSKYLSEGKPGFVSHRWASLSEAVGMIVDAGGIAIVAHPGRYKLDHVQRAIFLDEFQAAGGRGIEVHTGSHSIDQYAEYAQIARQTGLLASCGADFHSLAESRVDLGALPPMPKDLRRVWDTFRDVHF